jgi:hypothetical protein
MILIYRKLKRNLLKNLLSVIGPPALAPRRMEIEKMEAGTLERLHARMNQVTLLIPVGKHLLGTVCLIVVFAIVMYKSVTFVAERNQVVRAIMPEAASRLFVMDLKVATRSAALTTPAIPLRHAISKEDVIFRI